MAISVAVATGWAKCCTVHRAFGTVILADVLNSVLEDVLSTVECEVNKVITTIVIGPFDDHT